ncbi:MAG: hypothetical protein GY898_23310 [Proteobacteria bacterium]|nr:hypothetical protein [Pseudomonadota bacterium]
MTRTITTLGLAAALVASSVLVPTGTSHADPAAAESCLDGMVAGAIASGMRMRASDVTSAGPQEAVTYRLTLYKGLSYVLLGCADGGEGLDLDMKLYDKDGNIVSADKSPDHQPFVDVSPPETGEYQLQVLVYKTEAAKTDFAVAIAYVD